MISLALASTVECSRIMVMQAYDAIRNLFPMRPSSFGHWEKMFKRSSAVHFFSKRTAGLRVVDDPASAVHILKLERYRED